MAEQTSRLAIIIDSSGAQKNAESLTSALIRMTQTGDKATAGAEKVTKVTRQESEAFEELKDKIMPVNSELSNMGGAPRKALDDITKQLSKTGMSAAQTANAMRMVPAQFTDIVVSLASGQAPLTVLLQQGGQLKDMFGGVGPALGGVGRYALGLIGPFTGLSAVVAGLAFAWHQNQEEMSALNKSASTLNNTSGLTLTQMKSLAQASSALGVSYSNSIESISGLSKAINTNTDLYPRAIKAAHEYAWASGQELPEVIAMFNKLSENGGKSIDELDDKFSFLTVSQRKQADEALRSGNIADAQRIAFEGLSGTLENLTSKLNQGATGWDNFWKSVGKGASGGWQTLKEIVGGDYLDNADVRKYLERTRLRDQKTQAGTWMPEDERYYQMLNQSSPAVREYVRAQQSLADTTKEAAGSKYLKSLSDQVNDNADAVTRSRKALQALDNEFNSQPSDIRASGQADYAARRAQLLKNIKDAEDAANRKPRTKAYTEDAGTRMLDQLRQQNQILLSQADTGDRLGTQQQALIRWEQQLADIKGKQTLTAEQKSLLVNSDLITAALQQNVAIEKGIEARQRMLSLERARADIARTIENRQSQYGAEEFMSRGGMSQYEQQVYSGRLSLEQSYNDKISQLRQQKATVATDTARQQLDEEIQLQRQALDTELQNYDDHIARMNDARGSLTAGASRAWREYQDSAANASALSQEVFSNAFSGMEDAIVNFTLTGKASFSSFTKSVLSDIARIAARQGLIGLGSSLLPSLFTAGAGAATGGQSFAVPSFRPNAKGGVYDSPSLSSYSNGIYNSPQFFAFAKGAGVFGEAGPEAIMPLARGSNGSLGVRAIGASSSAPAINIGDINVEFNGEGQAADTSTQNTVAAAKQLQGIVLKTVTDWAKKEMSPGGVLYRKA